MRRFVLELWPCRRGRFLACVTVALLTFLAFPSLAKEHAVRTQHLQLQAGWHAIFLEVTPAANRPEEIFADSPVDVVAAYFAPASTIQFIQDPSEEPWNRPGWAVWYAEDRPESALSDLEAVLGNFPYLVHARAQTDLLIEGRVQHHTARWKANSFNLVGFCVDPQNRPSFADYFAGSTAQDLNRLYQLVNGTWQRVAAPTAARIEPGRAYWIYCRGRSSYQGPVALARANIGNIDFRDTGDTVTLQFKNTSPVEQTVTAEMIPADGLPLTTVATDYTKMKVVHTPLQSGAVLLNLPPQTSRNCRLHLRREQMTKREQAAALRVTATGGSVHWIPLHAIRSDQAAESD